MANKTRQQANLVSNGNIFSNTTDNKVGIGTTNPISKLSVSGDGYFVGVVTATSFIGDGSGLTGAGSTVADDTSTNGTFYPVLTQTTSGTITASKVSTTKLSFNPSTGTVSSTEFSGSGASLTNLNASNLSSGVVPAARITSTSALNVGGDLYVSGNISFGGTTTQLNTSQLTFSDPDIVLGVGTTSTFNPTDNTANHGGIAIASTEGSPLVNLNIDPAEVLPSTYKKIMWFKNNTAGLGTDAWLSNYAVGIGSTQFPTGTRFASGTIQFGQSDINVVRNINSSGVVTATSATVNGGNLLVGSTSATGTSSQPLQVTGGAYVSNNLGIGITNPGATLDVNGTRIFHKLSGINTVEFGYGAGSGDNTAYGLYVPSGRNFYLYGNNTFQLAATSTGVGIGLTNPGQKLDVSGSIRASSQLISTVATGTAPLSVTSTTQVSNLNVQYVNGKSTGTSGNTIPLLDGSSNWSGSNTFGGQDTPIIVYSTNITHDVWAGGLEIREVNLTANTNTTNNYAPAITFHWGNVAALALKMFSDGTFRVIAQSNTGSPVTYRDTYVAALVATGNVTAYSSDRRLKENLKHIETPLEKVQKLNGYTFDWNKKSEELGFTPQHKENDIGLIAQEVQEVLPQAVTLAPFDRETENVSKSGENYLTIQYERLVPLLVEAIKEQQEQINTLKEEINNLKK